MANYIENFVEPTSVFLAWQAPDQMGDRFRWAVGKLTVTADGALTLRYFYGQEFATYNQGRALERAQLLGYAGYPAFAMRRPFHAEGVSEAFMRRLPPRSRPDFQAYKHQFRIGSLLEPTNLGLLAITEAKLPSDGFSVVDPFDAQHVLRDVLIEVAGYRYYSKDVGPLMTPGRMVEARAEDNPHDPNAVAFFVADQKLGNLNRLQAPAFREWLRRTSVTIAVERMNGRPDHPRAFLFARIRPDARMAA